MASEYDIVDTPARMRSEQALGYRQAAASPSPAADRFGRIIVFSTFGTSRSVDVGLVVLEESVGCCGDGGVGLDEANFQGPTLAAPGPCVGSIWVCATHAQHPPRCDGSATGRRPGHRLRQGRSADPGDEVLLLATGRRNRRPSLRLDEKAAAFRGGSDGLKAIRPGHECRERADPARREPRPGRADAPEGEPLTPTRSARSGPGSTRGQSGPTIRRAREKCPGPLGLPAARPPGRAAGPNQELGPEPDRPLHPRPPRCRGAVALARGGSGHPAPPPQPRPDRPATLGRGGRRLPGRHDARMPTSGSSIACWPRRTTASAGAGTGSTPPATPTPTATRRTSRASSGSTATG